MPESETPFEYQPNCSFEIKEALSLVRTELVVFENFGWALKTKNIAIRAPSSSVA